MTDVNVTCDEIFVHHPIVFVVKNNYQIVFNTSDKGIAWVEIGGEIYKDAINGVVKSERYIHRIEIPQSVLNNAREYTIGYAKIEDRVPYHPQSGEHITRTYKFRPYDKRDGGQIYMLADTHSHATAPARAASFFGDKLDLLILNGDIGNKSSDMKNVMTIYRVADLVCKGEIPVVYARGNHETRGVCAEILHDYVGSEYGNSFFSFRIGNVWGIVLDCGEDKEDTHVEYGEIAHYRRFREAQTEYLKNMIKNAKSEYGADGVEYKIAVCHVPFTQIAREFADDIYNEWTVLLNEIDIDVMLSGHRHRILFEDGGKAPENKEGPNFPVVVGARMNDDPFADQKNNINEFCATALIFSDTKTNDVGEDSISSRSINIKFTNSLNQVVGEHTIIK